MDYLNVLKEKGYLWVIMPKRNRKRFLATKADTINGQFQDDDKFDEYSFETGEKWELEKGIWYRL